MDSKKIGIVNCDDERLCYEFVDPAQKVPAKHRCHSDVQLDYDVPLTKEATNKGHTQPLPISFFSIAYGDVEAGKKWYQFKFPKLSDELAYLLSRYSFGDLKYATKKNIRNGRKKYQKKNKNEKPPFAPLSNPENPFLIRWD